MVVSITTRLHAWPRHRTRPLGSLVNAPGSSFPVNGAAAPANSALNAAAAEFLITASWTLLAKFDGELAAAAQTYAATGTLKYSW
jgi:uncharacterized protein with beta-barrel porin domain